MKYAVVYSSKTGNTARLAQAIREHLSQEACLYFGPPSPQALEAPFLFVGFWTDKGTCDQESAAIAQVCFVHNVPCGVVRAVSDATDGAHGDEFKVYAPRAAEIAAGIVWRFLEKFGNNLQ